MMLKRKLKTLQLNIDKLSFRERLIVFFMVASVIVGLWLTLIYDAQQKWFDNAQLKKEAELEQTKLFDSKRQQIILKAQNGNVLKMIKQHDALRQAISKLNDDMGDFKHEFVPPKELASMLYSMLKEMKGIKLLNFESLLEEKEAEKNSENESVISNKIMLNRYRLALEGEYLLVLLYLQKLESIEWRLYWDKFDYHVINYPHSAVIIDFYTLTNKSLLGTL